MSDLVQKLVGALERISCAAKATVSNPEWIAAHADAALSEAKAGGWQDVKDCPDGDVWFALSCGHVVMGWKHGPLVLDWEASIDHDCCCDASAIKCQTVAVPAPPAQKEPT